jgi:hypothetical protein
VPEQVTLAPVQARLERVEDGADVTGDVGVAVPGGSRRYGRAAAGAAKVNDHTAESGLAQLLRERR